MNGRLHAACLLVVLSGCAAPEAAAPPKSAITRAPDGPRWKTNLLPTQGITVEMPGDAEEQSTATDIGADKLYFHGISFTSAGRKDEYLAGVYNISTPDRFIEAALVLDHLRGTFSAVSGERPAKHRDLEGVALKGKTEDGARFSLRAYLIGTSVYMLRVASASGEVDERAAERFFDSFRLVVPFRLFVSTFDHFTIARPEAASFESGSAKAPAVPGGISKTYLFSYGESDSFSISVVPFSTKPADPALADEVAENIVLTVGKKDGNVIEQIKSIEIDGAPGRDATVMDAEGKFTRMLVVPRGTDVFIVSRYSSDRAKMTDRDAELFLGSFTLGRVQ
jgi:hypothetical protein